MRQLSPLTTGSDEIQDRIDDATRAGRAWSATTGAIRYKRTNCLPLTIGQIGWVTAHSVCPLFCERSRTLYTCQENSFKSATYIIMRDSRFSRSVHLSLGRD